ncbi:MAG: 2-oxo acid dehydrogenase subunit E2 [Chloroflexi bacterium]|nr:2-oxo acid dehydrogenase subunit E2 [Chloroflexota bacterium]
MSTPIIMPKFEMSQETGTVTRWLKQEGDAIEKGEAILEVETDKVTMEVESPAKGILSAISAQPGDVIPIGQVIAQIESGLPTADQRPPTTDRRPPTVSDLPSVVRRPSSPSATPVAEKMAAEAGLDLMTVRGTGKNGQITREDVEKATADRRPPTTDHRRPVADDGKQQTADRRPPITEVQPPAAVPAARRLARELNVDLRSVRGTGPDGRIQSADVERMTANRRPPTTVDGPRSAVDSTPSAVVDRPSSAVTPPAAVGGPRSAVEVPPSAVGGRPSAVDSPAIRRIVPLSGIRRTIASRMLASVNEAPQFNLSVDVQMARALAIVDDFKVSATNGSKVTLTAFMIKACAWALARNPAINATFTPDGIVEYADVNVGIAVALDDGLIVPVIHRASTLDLGAIAAQLSDLAARARAGKLAAADLQGGTFSISNLGMFAVDRFTAIVNPPQAAILAIGRTTKRFVPDANDQPVTAAIATFTVSADHRAVDGAQVGRFLGDLQQVIERPGVML